MRRRLWLTLFLLILFILIQITKNPYLPLEKSSGTSYTIFGIVGTWAKIFFLLTLILFIITFFLSIEWKINKNPKVDDKRFFKTLILSNVIFFSMFFIFYLIVKKNKETLMQMLQIVSPPSPPSNTVTPPPATTTTVNTIVLTLFFITLCIFLIYIIFKRFKKKNIHYSPQNEQNEESFLLTEEGDPRRMIMAYYKHACHLLSRRGFESRPFQTPRQYGATVKTPFREPLETLTPLFEEAKYSNHRLTEKEKETAKLLYEIIKGGIDD
jgi:preprotein translocase subunit SecG